MSETVKPLVAMIHLLYRARTSALLVFLLGVAGTIALAVFTRPVYRSQVVMAVADEGEGLSSLLGQFGGLASLAGINLGGGGKSNRAESIAVLSSRDFTRRFIEREKLLPVLFATKWDESRQNWKTTNPDKIPQLGDGVKKFEERVREVNVDERTGLITVTVDWYDRQLAATWANKLVAAANEELRTRAIAEARRSLDYLEAEAQKTSATGVRDAIYKVVETQIKTIMLANVREQYAFKVLDQAVPADKDKYIWPRRVLIIALGFVFSVLLAIGWVLAMAVVGRLRADFHESKKLR